MGYRLVIIHEFGSIHFGSVFGSMVDGIHVVRSSHLYR